MFPDRQDALDDLSLEALCARFQLTPHGDGSFRHSEPATDAAAQKTEYILLPAAEYLPWQRCDGAVTLHHIAGGPLALSLSPDGHHAEAHHLHKHQHVEIDAKNWHTAETLGRWSLIALTRLDAAQTEPAAENWFPSPMASPQGSA